MEANIEKTVGEKPEKAVMDAGYYSKDNLERAEKIETDCYVTSRKWEEEVVEMAKEDRVKEYVEIRSNREIADAIRRMAAKLQAEEGKEIYCQRKKIVEPVFGQMKFNLEFRRFRLKKCDILLTQVRVWREKTEAIG